MDNLDNFQYTPETAHLADLAHKYIRELVDYKTRVNYYRNVGVLYQMFHEDGNETTNTRATLPPNTDMPSEQDYASVHQAYSELVTELTRLGAEEYRADNLAELLKHATWEYVDGKVDEWHVEMNFNRIMKEVELNKDIDPYGI